MVVLDRNRTPPNQTGRSVTQIESGTTTSTTLAAAIGLTYRSSLVSAKIRRARRCRRKGGPADPSESWRRADCHCNGRRHVARGRRHPVDVADFPLNFTRPFRFWSFRPLLCSCAIPFHPQLLAEWLVGRVVLERGRGGLGLTGVLLFLRSRGDILRSSRRATSSIVLHRSARFRGPARRPGSHRSKRLAVEEQAARAHDDAGMRMKKGRSQRRTRNAKHQA